MRKLKLNERNIVIDSFEGLVHIVKQIIRCRIPLELWQLTRASPL